MNLLDFYNIYIPALEKALDNDTINYGFYINDPSDYLNCTPSELKEIEMFLDKVSGENPF